MRIKLSRRTGNLFKIIDFYGRVLGLELLSEFTERAGYKGVCMGKPGGNWCLQFVKADIAPDYPADEGALLILYAETELEFTLLKQKLIAEKVFFVKPTNSTLPNKGITVEDPDGNRVMLSLILT